MNPYQATQFSLSEQEKQQIVHKFTVYDADHNGMLSRLEFRFLLNEQLNRDHPSSFMNDLIEEALRQEPGDVDIARTMNAITSIRMKSTAAMAAGAFPGGAPTASGFPPAPGAFAAANPGGYNPSQAQGAFPGYPPTQTQGAFPGGAPTASGFPPAPSAFAQQQQQPGMLGGMGGGLGGGRPADTVSSSFNYAPPQTSEAYYGAPQSLPPADVNTFTPIPSYPGQSFPQSGQYSQQPGQPFPPQQSAQNFAQQPGQPFQQSNQPFPSQPTGQPFGQPNQPFTPQQPGQSFPPQTTAASYNQHPGQPFPQPQQGYGQPISGAQPSGQSFGQPFPTSQPSGQPFAGTQPSGQPFGQPSGQPFNGAQPSGQPLGQPSGQPFGGAQPSGQPFGQPLSQPSGQAPLQQQQQQKPQQPVYLPPSAYDPFVPAAVAAAANTAANAEVAPSRPPKAATAGSITNQMQNTHIGAPPSTGAPSGILAPPSAVQIPASIAKMNFVPPGGNVASGSATGGAIGSGGPAAFRTSQGYPKLGQTTTVGSAEEGRIRSQSFPTPAPQKQVNPFTNTPPSPATKAPVLGGGISSAIPGAASGARALGASGGVPAAAGASGPAGGQRVMMNPPPRPMPRPVKNPAIQAMSNRVGDLHHSGELQRSATSGAHHYVSQEEKRAFIEYLNTNPRLREDPDIANLFPIDHNTDQLFEVVSEGALFCKLLNSIKPDLIPNHLIKIHPRNTFEKAENHNMAIAAAKKLGCSVVNIGSEDLIQGKAHLVMGLLWQMIKHDILSKLSIAHHPEIYQLADDTSNLKELQNIAPEEVLLKWANHHLKRANCGIILKNFSHDVRDGAAYAILMNQIAPDMCSLDVLQESDMARRAQMIVDNAKKLGADRFVTAKDIQTGNARLNLGFMADLFNKHSAMELPSIEEMERLKRQNQNIAATMEEADARLRQILADGQLAYMLQQQEIEEYRRFKLEEAKQLAAEEAYLIAEQKREEQSMNASRNNAIVNQEAFAREEQKRENERAASGRRSGSQSSSAAPSSIYSTAPASRPSASTATSSSRPAAAPSSIYSSAPSSRPAPSYSGANAPYMSSPYSGGARPPAGSQPVTTYDSTSTFTPAPGYVPTPGYGNPAIIPGTHTTTSTVTTTKVIPPTTTTVPRPPSPDREPARIPIVQQPKLGWFGRAGQKIDRTFH